MSTQLSSEFPVLPASHLLLREHAPSDKEAYFALMSDARAVRYYGRLPLTSLDEVDREFEDIRQGFEKSVFVKWAVAWKDTNRYVGSVGAWGLGNPHGRATLSCILSPAEWGKGIGHEALNEVMNYLFSELRLNRLQVYVDPANERAMVFFRKAGFQTEGVLREYEYEYGGFIDIAIMSVLRKNFHEKSFT